MSSELPSNYDDNKKNRLNEDQMDNFNERKSLGYHFEESEQKRFTNPSTLEEASVAKSSRKQGVTLLEASLVKD